MQKRHHPHLAAAATASASPSSSSGGGGSSFGFCFNDIMELDAGSGGDHRAPGTPTNPRSKHSATEQRRRCKINESHGGHESGRTLMKALIYKSLYRLLLQKTIS